MFELTNELLVRALLFVLILSVTYFVLMRFLKNKGSAIVIGLVISLIAEYYLSYSQLELLTKIYGNTGITILILVPFIIVFFFIYSSNIPGLLRKMLWVFYGIMTIFLLRENELFTEFVMTLFILALIMILFLDKTIKNKLTARRNIKIKKW